VPKFVQIDGQEWLLADDTDTFKLNQVLQEAMEDGKLAYTQVVIDGSLTELAIHGGRIRTAAVVEREVVAPATARSGMRFRS
jgi:hypothetical protein